VHLGQAAQHRRKVFVRVALAVVQRVDRRAQLLDGAAGEVLRGVEVGGPWASETNASMPCVSASSPVAALSASGMVVSSLGSITETSGTRARPIIVILVRRSVSVTMQNWETSAPVPEVDGSMINGGIGCSIRSMPS
jgi:hypothetical protein